ncbi:MAG: TIGR04211 family SH3 domain-containing protein [Deltaproteobacteria bacterium]|nr:TIGR04211 family SH3 domain-containing protein [Deltaproteobacteria bacterium]
MKKLSTMAAILVITCAMTNVGWARMAYVTDSFRISLRTGPSLENKILKFLPSGEPVEVLDTQEGWDQIEALNPEQEGLKGWVLSRYLMERIPWEQQAKASIRENGEMRKKLVETQEALNRTTSHEKELKKKLQETVTAMDKIENDFRELKKGAPDYLRLKVAYENGLKKIEGLTRENDTLKSSQTNRFFALGALVLLCGLMLGVVTGRQQRKRRSLLYS